MTTDQINTEIAELKERLALYLQKEAEILKGGVQAYGIGNRSLTKYNADLAGVRAAIKELQKDIAELEARLAGTGPRRAVRIIPQDW